MTTALSNLQGLYNALSAPAVAAQLEAFTTSHPYPGVTVGTSSIVTQLAGAIAQYTSAEGSSSPADLVQWTATYEAAFTAADLAYRWANGASTQMTNAPYPSSPTTFDTTSGTFNTLVANCTAAESSALAPTNGQPAMPSLAAAVVTALAALQNAWNGGPPTPSSGLVASFQALIWQATAIAGALGITWSPAS